MTTVPPMTAKTNKWIVLFQEIIRNSTMGIVTDVTIFFNRGMLVEKGTLFIGMTVIAKGINVHLR